MSTDSADSESASPRASLSPATESEGTECSLVMDLDALLAGEDLPPTVDSPPWEPSYRIFKNFDSAVLCSTTDDENSNSCEGWELPDPEENFTRLSLKRMASFSDEEDSVLSAPKFPRLDVSTSLTPESEENGQDENDWQCPCGSKNLSGDCSCHEKFHTVLDPALLAAESEEK